MDLINEKERLVIRAGNEIKIYFKGDVCSLDNFFNSKEDANAEKIISIKIYFNETSNITNLNYLFAGCSLLKTIEFNYFNSSSLKEMNSIFLNCTSLE